MPAPAPSAPTPASPPGLVEPVPADLLRLLRRAVLDHATSERRRVFSPVLHVGAPGTGSASYEVVPDEPIDHTLRTEVVEALVRRVRRPGVPLVVWLTRPGDLVVQDVDLAWSAAACSAAGELGLVGATGRPALPMVVVNKRCWRDPRTGVGRVWQRLRR